LRISLAVAKQFQVWEWDPVWSSLESTPGEIAVRAADGDDPGLPRIHRERGGVDFRATSEITRIFLITKIFVGICRGYHI
jgi:hypothetical protein